MNTNFMSSDGYIIDQSLAINRPYGKSDSVITGCGWMAAFNFLKATGHPLPEKQVRLSLSQGWFKGRLGTGPLRLKEYLQKNSGLPLETALKRKKVLQLARQAGAGVLLYNQENELHFVTFIAVEDGLFRFFNAEYGNPAYIMSMQDFITKNCKWGFHYIMTTRHKSEVGPKGTQPLSTPRLLLRPFVPQDAQAMFENWASDPRVTRYLRWAPHQSVQESQEIVNIWCESYKKNDFYQWVIQVQETGELIGTIGIMPETEPGEPSGWVVGYCIGRAFWSRGYTTEALSAALSYFIQDSGVTTVRACHAKANPASGRVLLKNGFLLDHEGICHLENGREVNALYYIYHRPMEV